MTMKKIKSLKGFKKINNSKLKYEYMINSKGVVVNKKTRHILSPRKNGRVIPLHTNTSTSDYSISKLVNDTFKTAKKTATKKATAKKVTAKKTTTKKAAVKKATAKKTTMEGFSNYVIHKSGKVVNIKSGRNLKPFYVSAEMRKVGKKCVAMRDDTGKVHKFGVDRLVKRAFA